MSDIDTIRRELRPWTSPTGEVRYYVDDWYGLIGDVVEDYARNEWMSPDLSKIKRARVWYDTGARVHIDNLRTDDELILEVIRSNLEDRFFNRIRLFILTYRQLFHIPKPIPIHG
jgi:hypothetical protein